MTAVGLIQRHEGLRLLPYLCPANVVTIGWGHVLRDANGLPLVGGGGLRRAKQQYPDGITTDQAMTWLREDIAQAEDALARLVEVPLTANQRGALVSFIFNVGLGAFSTSTLRRKLNAGDYASVPSELARWKHGGGKVLRGLVERRAAEAQLWRTPDEPTVPH